MARTAQDVIDDLRDVSRTSGGIGPTNFRDEADTSVNTTGSRSLIAELPVETVHRILSGRSNPFRVAVPAYEQFSSDGTGGNTETFNLSHDLIQCPNTQNVVVYIGGSYYGNPDAVDYANDSIDVTDPGSNNNVHVWYMPGDTATLEVYKATPSSSASANEELYTEALNLANQTKQAEQPEFFELNQSALQPFLASDMRLNVYVKAPYEVRFEDPAGDGATPDNMLLHIPVERGATTVAGLKQLIKSDMGSR
ncbi:hypothetical protein [Haloplanus pelagicus]|uniref:hypothetical protein n=1 Tax=Haloplanus pelagicus TaxID=2949995 RepID=UPI002040153E|nr:hypothetical protein [Haloplanus sp. HW8-1]